MDALQTIKQPIVEEIARYNDVFESYFSHSNALLNEVLNIVGSRKGKMMRPVLTMLSARLFGEITDAVINAAATFEFCHTASLVHDDVVDGSDQRRGQTSINGSHDNRIAVLVGDYILANALHCASDAGSLRLIKVLSLACQCLSNGELLQMRSVHNRKISEEVYFDIIKNKTAALFSACAEAGAMIAGAPDEDVENLRKFGEIVGICFQIRDDIFDYTDSEEIGKPTGNDMKEGKLTLPVIHALYKVGSEEMFALARKVKEGNVSADEIASLVDFAKSNGGIEYAWDVMQKKSDEAKYLLSKYPDSSVKDSLLRYVDYVMGRKI